MGPLVLALLALPGADAVAQDRPPPAARVSLDASPEATVQVDDAVELETPVDIKLLRPGRHSFTFRRWGFRPKTVELELSGRPARVNVALEPTVGRTLLAFGYAVAFGYSGVGLTPRGREAGIASRWAHGAAFSLSGQAFHFLEGQLDAGGWTMNDVAPPPPLAGETARKTYINSEFVALSGGLTTPALPVLRGRWVGLPGDLLLTASGRLGYAWADVTRHVRACDECPSTDLDVSAGAFRELSLSVSWGYFDWPRYVGLGVRVARRSWLHARSFDDELKVLVEARLNLPTYEWPP